MNIFQGALDLTIWTIVVFVILFYILRTYAWGPIREGLDKREQSIAHDKLEAVRAKQEADALRAKLDQELARANEQVRQIMDKARQDAEALAAQEVARGKAELQAEKDRLLRDLKAQEAQMEQALTARTAALATLISAKVVKKSLGEEEHRALLDEALAEFRTAARSRVDDLTSARA
jgi:F-type H+-transporting ATPase subunit b